MTIHKGLDRKQRERVVCAYRPDTIVVNDSGIPVISDALQVPSDGQTVTWWYDVSNQYANVHANAGTSIVYDSAINMVDFGTGDNYFECWPSAARRNSSYWNLFHGDGFRLACVFRFYGSVTTADVHETIFSTGNGDVSNGDVGLLCAVQNDGEGQYLRIAVTDGSSTIWDTANDPDTSIDLSDPHDLFINQSSGGVLTPSVSVELDEEVIFSNDDITLNGSVDADHLLTIGADNGSSFSESMVRGILVDTEDSLASGSEMLDWIDGADYDG